MAPSPPPRLPAFRPAVVFLAVGLGVTCLVFSVWMGAAIVGDSGAKGLWNYFLRYEVGGIPFYLFLVGYVISYVIWIGASKLLSAVVPPV